MNSLIFDRKMLFEQVKNKADLGIGADMLSSAVMEQTGSEIIKDAEKIAELKEYRWIAVARLLTYKLSEYGIEEWYACLQLKLFLEYTVPMLSRVLSQNPILNGAYWKGELLWNILKIEDSFWKSHKEWKEYFELLLVELFESYSETEIMEIAGERPYQLLKEIRVEL